MALSADDVQAARRKYLIVQGLPLGFQCRATRFIEIKRAEWEDYRLQVTPWEIEQFLPVL